MVITDAGNTLEDSFIPLSPLVIHITLGACFNNHRVVILESVFLFV